MAVQIPIVGEWYQDPVENQLFEVVAIDEQFSAIEIQYLDGEVGEIDFESWGQMPLSNAEAPEDPGAAYELSREDDWNNDHSLVPENWSNPLASIEPESFPGIDEY